MKVSDAMRRDVLVASPTQSIRDAAKMMAKIAVGRAPQALIASASSVEVSISLVSDLYCQRKPPSQRRYRGQDFPRRALHVGGKINFNPRQARDIFVPEPTGLDHLPQNVVVGG